MQLKKKVVSRPSLAQMQANMQAVSLQGSGTSTPAPSGQHGHASMQRIPE